MRRQASAVVATKREKILWSPRGKRELGAQSAILLRKVGGGFKRLSWGEEFPINSVKAEPGEKTESSTGTALKRALLAQDPESSPG